MMMKVTINRVDFFIYTGKLTLLTSLRWTRAFISSRAAVPGKFHDTEVYFQDLDGWGLKFIDGLNLQTSLINVAIMEYDISNCSIGANKVLNEVTKTRELWQEGNLEG